MSDFVCNLFKIIAFHNAEFFQNLIFMNGEKFMNFDARAFRQNSYFQIIVCQRNRITVSVKIAGDNANNHVWKVLVVIIIGND